MKCLHPECQKEARTRGLCNSHYTYANALVKKGKTTWAELIEKGKASEPTRSKSWFLS